MRLIPSRQLRNSPCQRRSRGWLAARCLVVCGTSCWLSAAPPAHAQESNGAHSPAAVAPALSPEREAEARKAYERGLEAYRERDYARAIVSFRAAYEISQAALLLYNLAQAHRLRGDCHEARALYRDFLATKPLGRPRELAEQRERELADCESAPAAERETAPGAASRATSSAPVVAARSRPKSTVPAPAVTHENISDRLAPERSRKRKSPVLALVSVGAGAVLLGLSGYFAWRADRASDEVSAVFANRGRWSQALAEREDDGQRSATLSAASLVGGVLAAGTGSFLLAFN